MTATIILAAFIVAASTGLSSFMVTRQFQTARRAERMEDYARAEARADRASEQTRRLIATNERIARRTNETADILENKLDVIHTLVNSAMTAAKQSEHDAIEREVAMMKEVIALNAAAGRPASEEAVAALEATTLKLVDLRAELAARRAQDEAAAKQVEQQRAAPEAHEPVTAAEPPEPR